jgi:hypothetical protein
MSCPFDHRFVISRTTTVLAPESQGVQSNSKARRDFMPFQQLYLAAEKSFEPCDFNPRFNVAAG